MLAAPAGKSPLCRKWAQAEWNLYVCVCQCLYAPCFLHPASGCVSDYRLVCLPPWAYQCVFSGLCLLLLYSVDQDCAVCVLLRSFPSFTACQCDPPVCVSIGRNVCTQLSLNLLLTDIFNSGCVKSLLVYWVMAQKGDPFHWLLHSYIFTSGCHL